MLCAPVMYEIDAEEGPWASDKKFPDGNTGHRPPMARFRSERQRAHSGGAFERQQRERGEDRPRQVERRPPVPLTLRQVDPLIRQLTLYRDLIDQKTGGSE